MELLTKNYNFLFLKKVFSFFYSRSLKDIVKPILENFILQDKTLFTINIFFIQNSTMILLF